MTKPALSDLVAMYGYKLIEYPEPDKHPDALGSPGDFAGSAVLSGKRLAVRTKEICTSNFYSAAHEIAEDLHGFGHTELMWIEQCNILARWGVLLAQSTSVDN